MLVGVRGVVGVVSGGCFVVFLVVERCWKGGFLLVLPCREKEEREERESVLNAWC